MHWQRIAERLAEAGWSWKHCERTHKKRNLVHLIEAHNLDGEVHCVVADSINEGFHALKNSIKAAK